MCQGSTTSKRQDNNYYNTLTGELPDIHVGSSVANQHPQTRLWETYEIIIAVSPHCKYYIKIQSGRVFVAIDVLSEDVLPCPSPLPSINQHLLLSCFHSNHQKNYNSYQRNFHNNYLVILHRSSTPSRG